MSLAQANRMADGRCPKTMMKLTYMAQALYGFSNRRALGRFQATEEFVHRLADASVIGQIPNRQSDERKPDVVNGQGSVGFF